MKRSKLILSITTLILTIACLTFGVYSAVRTSFVASGTITFNSYEIDADIQIDVYGVQDGVLVSTENESAPYNIEGLKKRTIKTSTSGNREGFDKMTNSNIDLGDLTFDELNTDLADDNADWRKRIAIVITFYNYSDFDAQMSVTQSATQLNGLSINYGTKVIAKEYTSEKVSSNALTICVEADETYVTGTFNPQVTIKPETTELELVKRLVSGTANTSNAKYEYYYRTELGSVNTSSFTTYDIVTANDVGKTDKFISAPTWAEISTQKKFKSGLTNQITYWRYLGDESRDASTTEPTSRVKDIQKGVYLLDTFVDNQITFNETYTENGVEVYNSSYRDSYARKYLDGQEVIKAGGSDIIKVQNKFFTDYNLSEYFQYDDSLNSTIKTTGVVNNDLAKKIIRAEIDYVVYDDSSNTLQTYFYLLSNNQYKQYLQYSVDDTTYTDSAIWVLNENYSIDNSRNGYYLRSSSGNTAVGLVRMMDGSSTAVLHIYFSILRPAFQIG